MEEDQLKHCSKTEDQWSRSTHKF